MPISKRPAWAIKDDKVICRLFDFVWDNGISNRKKRNNILALHKAIIDETGATVLELSYNGVIELGKYLSAFVLPMGCIPLENHYHASKVYENGGPYTDLLTATARNSQRDPRHHNSGKLKAFVWKGDTWDLIPRTVFYDYIYNLAMVETYGITLDSYEYEWFTDISFNQYKAINCQARALAVYKLLQQMDAFAVLYCKEAWLNFYRDHIPG